MGPRKVLSQIIAAALALTALSTTSVKSAADTLDCANFTSYRYVRQMRIIDDTVFMATSGGVLAVTSPGEKGQMYRNLNGLGTNDIWDIMKDASGQKWVAGFGRLIRFGGNDTRQFYFFDYDNSLFALRRLADDGDNIWVGTEKGLVLFSKVNEGGQIKDSYQLFGSLNPSPLVNDILLNGDSIWIATSNGLAVADRSDPLQLKSPAAWISFNLGNHPELGQDSILRVTRYQSNIYISSSRGLFRLDIDSGAGDTVFTQMLPGGPVPVTDIKVDNDTLFVYDSLGCAYYVGGAVTYFSISGVPVTGLTGANTGSYRWIASASGGIYQNSTGNFTVYPYIGTPGNNVTDIAVDASGNLFAGFDVDHGARLVDSNWVQTTSGIRASTRIAVDSTNHIWFGTLGGGLYYFNGTTVKHYDRTNTPMFGNNDRPPSSYDYIINTDLATDGNYLYVTCYKSFINYPVVIADLNNLDNRAGWDSLGIENGLTDMLVTSIAIHNGRLVVGDESDGVYIAQVGENPLQTDIQFDHYTRANKALISDDVRIVRFAPDGSLWVGTNFGLSRLDDGIDRFVDVNLPAGLSSDITDLEFDGRGNLWIGTKNGLGVRDAITGEVTVFNSFNSDISGDFINAVTVDHRTGKVYIATTSGFTITPGLYGTPTNSVDDIIAFPNPFVINSPDDRVKFNLDKAGTLRIFTAAGELVRNMPLAAWDGKNNDGKAVASGVYLYVITDVDGNVGKGKLLLVRR